MQLLDDSGCCHGLASDFGDGRRLCAVRGGTSLPVGGLLSFGGPLYGAGNPAGYGCNLSIDR